MSLDVNEAMKKLQPTHTICCGGQVVAGPTYIAPILTFLLIFVTSAIFIPFSIMKLPYYIWYWALPIHLYLALFSCYNELRASFMDPGIIPRSTFQFSRRKSYKCNKLTNSTDPLHQNHNAMLYMGTIYKMKYCLTCNIIRPPRASHCAICNSCIMKMDHHCPWLGTCVARRNYCYFFMFILHSFMLSCFDLILGIIHIVFSVLNNTLVELWCPIIAILCGLFGFFFIGNLVLIHFGLIQDSLTTKENINETYALFPNPFNRNDCLTNCYDALKRSSKYPSLFCENEIAKKKEIEREREREASNDQINNNNESTQRIKLSTKRIHPDIEISIMPSDKDNSYRMSSRNRIQLMHTTSTNLSKPAMKYKETEDLASGRRLVEFKLEKFDVEARNATLGHNGSQ